MVLDIWSSSSSTASFVEAGSATCVKQISNVHIISYKSDALHSQCYVTCATVILGLEVGFVCCVLDMFVELEFGIFDVDDTLSIMPFKQVASSGMKARLLIYSQPHSTLCNKTLIGTMGCNADAAAAMCKVLGQQLDTLSQEQAQQKQSTLSHRLQQLQPTSKPLHHKCGLTDLFRPDTHCKTLQFAHKKEWLTSLLVLKGNAVVRLQKLPFVTTSLTAHIGFKFQQFHCNSTF